jgi:hypothetical protein
MGDDDSAIQVVCDAANIQYKEQLLRAMITPKMEKLDDNSVRLLQH